MIPGVFAAPFADPSAPCLDVAVRDSQDLQTWCWDAEGKFKKCCSYWSLGALNRFQDHFAKLRTEHSEPVNLLIVRNEVDQCQSKQASSIQCSPYCSFQVRSTLRATLKFPTWSPSRSKSQQVRIKLISHCLQKNEFSAPPRNIHTNPIKSCAQTQLNVATALCLQRHFQRTMRPRIFRTLHGTICSELPLTRFCQSADKNLVILISHRTHARF